MNFTSQMRYNPETGEYEKYYRLKESYRNASGRACTRILLNVGFIHGLRPEEIRDISCGLTYKYEHQGEHELRDDQLAVYSDVVCQTTDDLFRPTNRIMLFDLTNFYFEGRKDASRKAQFGRSKEKRSDCKLLVLALAINTDGFIRYSAILEGNTADPKSLPDMVDNLIARNPVGVPEDQKVLVVIDAGIASQENLDLIKAKGYNYLCVSRKALTDYTVGADTRTVTVHDSKKQPIKLQEVHTDGEDYYLKIDSPAKALKEESMNRSFRRRFEEGLNTITASLQKKGGTKRYEAVLKRIGKLEGRYPSIARYYHIDIRKDAKDKVTAVTWTLEIPEKQVYGTYFLRTNVKTLDEKTTWDYYNLIREIECSNRQLKTDLNLRPIYHQKDDRSDAHLFLGLFSYWIVNVIRHQMKKENEKRKKADPDPKAEYPTPYWTEIVRIMSTQKAVTSEAVNAMGERVEMRICSTPTEQAADIYSMLNYKKMPFRKIKICRTQSP